MKPELLNEIAELQDELICKGGGKKGQPKVNADPTKLARLHELLEERKKDPEFVEGKQPTRKKFDKNDAACVEREIRRYIKKPGGYRKDLPEPQKERADYLLGLANRKPEDGWDESILLHGFAPEGTIQ